MKKFILGLFLILGAMSFAAPKFVDMAKVKNKVVTAVDAINPKQLKSTLNQILLQNSKVSNITTQAIINPTIKPIIKLVTKANFEKSVSKDDKSLNNLA